MSLPVGCYHLFRPLPLTAITQPYRLHLFYHQMQSKTLNRCRHCHKGVQPMPKAVCSSSYHGKFTATEAIIVFSESSVQFTAQRHWLTGSKDVGMEFRVNWQACNDTSYGHGNCRYITVFLIDSVQRTQNSLLHQLHAVTVYLPNATSRNHG